MQTPLHATTLICTLSPSPAVSSSEKLARDLQSEFEMYGITNEFIRIVDHIVKPGVAVDMKDGDKWPTIRQKILDSDILVIATPVWMGHAASIAQLVLERLDAELSETNDDGLPYTYGKVAVAAIVGNEDGAHKASADIFQALNDVGFTIPAAAVTYWNGEAMHTTDYKDLTDIPDKVIETNRSVAANATHLATLLRSANYKPPKQ